MKLKHYLGSVATLVATVGARAYAQPVVPDDSSCPRPDNQQCPSPSTTTTTTTTQPGQTGQTATQPMQPTEPQAQPYTQQAPQEYTPESSTSSMEGWFDHNLAFSVGGGVDDFTRDAARRDTGVGGSWNARLTIGTRSYIAGEVSYIGSAQTMNNNINFASNNGTLYGNGAQGALRLNMLVNFPVQPFAYGGAAWRHYSFSQGSGSDDLLEIPAGVGIAAYVSDLMIDVRGEYRFAVAESSSLPMIGLTNSNSASDLDRWGVTGNLGYMF